MEIGTEISQKIRSAIKAKLVELGAYVDEELPDYIMVMVANKKSIAQMTDDLSLFLGTNTDKFTTWLHGLLIKLQSITSDPICVPKSDKSDKSSKAKDHPSSVGHEARATKGQKSSEDSSIKGKRHSTEDTSDSKEIKKRKLCSEKSASTVSVTDILELDSAKLGPKAEPSVSKATSEAPEEAVHVVDSVVPPKKIEEVQILEETLQPQQAETVTVIVKEATTKADSIMVTATEAVNNSIARIESSKKPGGPIHVVEEDDLSELLLTENDDLTAELELEDTVVPTNKKSESRSGDNAAKLKRESPTVMIILPNLSSASSTSSGFRPRAMTSPIRQSSCRTASVRPVESHPTELFTRKRRGPVSVVASVSREVEEDDGYDPYNPAVGNVASVVKVTARKSSVPPKLQANKSLLLKAMSEAEKSIETQRRVAITPIKPFMRSERKDKERDHERDRPARGSQSAIKDDLPGSRLARSSLKQIISQRSPTRRSDSPPVYIPTRKVDPAPRGSVTDRLGIVSKSRREEAQQRLRRGKKGEAINFVVKRERDDDIIIKRQPQDDVIIIKREPDEDILDLTEPSPEPIKQTAAVKQLLGKRASGASDSSSVTEIDSRVVECEPEIVASSAEEDRSVGSGSQGVPEILDVEPDEFVLDPDLDTAEAMGLYEEDRRMVDMKEKQKDKTRFVVTLDGVDEEAYEMGVSQEMMEVVHTEYETMEEGPVTGTPSVAAYSGSTPAHRSPPKVQQFSISLKDSDEEAEPMQEEEATPLQQAKMLERCKFWPACVNGAACEFHHPTIQCKTFPQCKFGDKCLYIHPNCRFDSRCLRPDCPYTHSSKRSIPPASMPMYRPAAPPPPALPVASTRIKNPPQCRFFPACSNLACPFIHPKPCRFGISCKGKERGCPFFHPSLPTKDKLKWQAGKASGKSGGDAVAKLVQ